MFAKLITAGSDPIIPPLRCRSYGYIPDPGFCGTGYAPVGGMCGDGIDD